MIMIGENEEKKERPTHINWRRLLLPQNELVHEYKSG